MKLGTEISAHIVAIAVIFIDSPVESSHRNLISTINMVSFLQIGGGLGIGGSIHIGNLLGANQPHKAKMSAYILLVVAGKTLVTLCLSF